MHKLKALLWLLSIPLIFLLEVATALYVFRWNWGHYGKTFRYYWHGSQEDDQLNQPTP